MEKLRILALELTKLIIVVVASFKAFANFQDSLSNYPKLPLNQHCQLQNNTLDLDICSYGRAQKYLWIYFDGMPVTGFLPMLDLFPEEISYFRVMNGDALESGPILETFLTGKISRNYFSKIAEVDHFIKQLKQADLAPYGFLMPYPIVNAIGLDDFFANDPNLGDLDPLTTQIPSLSNYTIGNPETDKKMYEVEDQVNYMKSLVKQYLEQNQKASFQKE